jgi:hypothetical protein
VTVWESRARLGLSFWPRSVAGRVGLSLGVSYGAGFAVTTLPGGRFSDTSVALAVAARVPLAGSWSLEPALAGAVHFTAIDGAFGSPSMHLEQTRANPSVDGNLVIGYDVGSRLQVGLAAGASYLLRNQRFLLQGVPVLTPNDWQLDVGLRIAVGVD